MPDVQITSLSLTDPDGRSIPNRYFRLEGARALGVLLPGLWYTCDMPLLYYARKVLTRLGADVLQVQADYTAPAFRGLPSDERLRRMVGDARAAIRGVQAQGDYIRLVLVGKSIGTISMAQLLARDLPSDSILVWLTPLMHQSWLVEAAMSWKGPSLLVAGTQDSAFDQQALVRLQEAGTEAFIVAGADHSLEVGENILRCAQIISEYVQALDGFLKRGLEEA
jgi:alpha-beta hydrolase superfamily lysophospholipase